MPSPKPRPFQSFRVANVLDRLVGHPTKTTLNAGDTLSQGCYLQSNAGEKVGARWVPRYQLVMQPDGDLTLYDRGRVAWSSHTAHRGGAYAVMQTDGNFVLFDCNHCPLWASGSTVPGSHLVLEDTGALAIYSPTRKRLWTSSGETLLPHAPVRNLFDAAVGADRTDPYDWDPDPVFRPIEAGIQPSYSKPVTGEIRQELYPPDTPGLVGGETLDTDQSLSPGQSLTSQDGSYVCSFQTDGNLVVYHRSGAVQWASDTNGKGATACVLQGDGNLVIYAGSRPLWDSGTRGSHLRVCMQNDGNLVIYDVNSPRWASKDHGGGTFLGIHLDVVNAVKDLLPKNAQPAFSQAVNAVQQGQKVVELLQAHAQSPPNVQTGVAAAASLLAGHRAVGIAHFTSATPPAAKAGNLVYHGTATLPPSFRIGPVQAVVHHPVARTGAVAAANQIAAKKSLWVRIKQFFGFGLHT